MTGRTRRFEGTMIVHRRAVTAVLAATTLLLTAGCSSDGGGGGGVLPDGANSASSSGTGSGSSPTHQAAEATPPAKGSVKVVRTVAEGLKTPWGLAPLPDGDLLVSSRDEGTITRVDGQ
jgi:glucose/arabinose dehydrogenase